MNFWDWFSSISGEFGDQFENKNLIGELDERISRLGPFSWEIGPGFYDPENSSLVISPARDLRRLQETRRIVAFAPPCPGWEFLSSKPAKRWDRQFSISIDADASIDIDASDWRYVLLRRPSRQFGIKLCAPNMRGLSTRQKDTAAEILLEGELGEETRLEMICDVEVLEHFDQQLLSRSGPIEELTHHLQSRLTEEGHGDHLSQSGTPSDPL